MGVYDGPMTSTTEYPVSEWDSWDGDTIVVIGCSEEKADHTAPASEVYTGSFFRFALKAARAMVPDEDIFVLSARHGFISIDTEVEPYDTTWASPDHVSDATMAEQFSTFDTSAVVAMTTNGYTARIQKAAEGSGVPVVAAFEGSRGIGDHRHHVSIISKFVDASRTSCPTCGHDMATTWGDGKCIPCNPR